MLLPFTFTPGQVHTSKSEEETLLFKLWVHVTR